MRKYGRRSWGSEEICGQLTCGNLRSKSQLPACRQEEPGREEGSWGRGQGAVRSADCMLPAQRKSQKRRTCTPVETARAAYAQSGWTPFERRVRSPPPHLVSVEGEREVEILGCAGESTDVF